MGIQNRNSKDKRGKNSVNVNINITETTPPKVVKVPTKVVRVPARATAKAKRKASKVVSASETDALSARPVEKLQELANEFSRVKDMAQSRGVPIPASYSQFSDIRDRASLQTNTELLQERIRQLNKSIASGGVAPVDASTSEVIPLVDPSPSGAVIPQPQGQGPQGPNMFDQPTVVELAELEEAQQMLKQK